MMMLMTTLNDHTLLLNYGYARSQALTTRFRRFHFIWDVMLRRWVTATQRFQSKPKTVPKLLPVYYYTTTNTTTTTANVYYYYYYSLSPCAG